MSYEITTTTNGGMSVGAWQPQNLTEAMRLAETVSKSGLVPDALRGKAADTLLVMMKGRELGLSVMQSLGNIHVIKGKAELSAAMMRGLVMARRDICEYLSIVESSSQVCRIVTKRVGHPEPATFTFTIEDAKAAGLTGNPNYQKFPGPMLLARCSGLACRAIYPDLVAGVYVEGEIETLPNRGSSAAAIAEAFDTTDIADAEVVSDAPPTTAEMAELDALVRERAKALKMKVSEYAQELALGYGAAGPMSMTGEQVRDAIAALKSVEEVAE